MSFEELAKCTVWLSKLKQPPKNLAEYDYLIRLLDIPELMVPIDLKKINTSARLDLIYLLAKLINVRTVEYCEYVTKNFFIGEFDKLFQDEIVIDNFYNDPNAIMAFLAEFYIDMGYFIQRYLGSFQQIIISSERIYHEIIEDLSMKMIKYCTSLLGNNYYTEIQKEFNIRLDKIFFQRHCSIFYSITDKIVQFTVGMVDSILTKLKIATTMLADPLTTDSQGFEMLNKLMNIEDIGQSSIDPIDEFIVTMELDMQPEKLKKYPLTKIYDYRNYLYDVKTRDEFSQYTFWNNSDDNDWASDYSDLLTVKRPSIESRYDLSVDDGDDDNYRDYDYSDLILNPRQSQPPFISGEHKYTSHINPKIKEMGMELYPPDGVTDVLQLFVNAKLVDTLDQLTDPICNMMETCRETPEIFNKYDEMDLETSYQLMAIANDIRTDYNDFLSKLKSRRLYDYPLEFLLRLISRIFNVNLVLYDKDLNPRDIDNAILPKITLNVYQCYHKYYLMLPQTTTTMPIVQTVSTTQSVKKKKHKCIEV